MIEIIANLKHAARNGGASIGGGEFSSAECRQAAAALTHAADLLAVLQRIATGEVMADKFNHAETVHEYQRLARAAIANATGGAE